MEKSFVTWCWRRAKRDKRFRECFDLTGNSLKRAPRDFPADHPLIEDIKRTDFIAVGELTERDVLCEDSLDTVATSCAAGRSFMRFLCRELNVPF